MLIIFYPLTLYYIYFKAATHKRFYYLSAIIIFIIGQLFGICTICCCFWCFINQFPESKATSLILGPKANSTANSMMESSNTATKWRVGFCKCKHSVYNANPHVLDISDPKITSTDEVDAGVHTTASTVASNITHRAVSWMIDNLTANQNPSEFTGLHTLERLITQVQRKGHPCLGLLLGAISTTDSPNNCFLTLLSKKCQKTLKNVCHGWHLDGTGDTWKPQIDQITVTWD